ncbi:MAG: endonuclease/exonuclease/phosphatase family protein [Wenzhouxiangellaceae bacterium]
MLSLLTAALLSVSLMSKAADSVRIASFNLAMGLKQGELIERLQRDDDPGLRNAAAIIQRVRPHILLLNEFDDEGVIDRAALFQQNYLGHSQFEQQAISYAEHYAAPVNTGEPSGVDLDGDGAIDSPGDAYGYGEFPGQYSMLLLSQFPIDHEQARTWRKLLWRDYPGATLPQTEDGEAWYSDEALAVMRLSSKSHWAVPIRINEQTLYLLAAHPTPPVFDGPEDRNGLRNFDEIGLLAAMIDEERGQKISDDSGQSGAIPAAAHFIIAGDLNASSQDGNARPGAMLQLTAHPRVQATFTPRSEGALQASQVQGGVNLQHQGDPAAATADFNDEFGPGNLRIDYVLPSSSLEVRGGGVFWPKIDDPAAAWIETSDHRLVWLDVTMPMVEPADTDSSQEN